MKLILNFFSSEILWTKDLEETSVEKRFSMHDEILIGFNIKILTVLIIHSASRLFSDVNLVYNFQRQSAAHKQGIAVPSDGYKRHRKTPEAYGKKVLITLNIITIASDVNQFPYTITYLSLGLPQRVVYYTNTHSGIMESFLIFE